MSFPASPVWWHPNGSSLPISPQCGDSRNNGRLQLLVYTESSFVEQTTPGAFTLTDQRLDSWDHGLYGGFMGNFYSWTVYFMENPSYQWMMSGATPISGNPHMENSAVWCFWVKLFWDVRWTQLLPGLDAPMSDGTERQVWHIRNHLGFGHTVSKIHFWLVVWNIFYFSIYWECHHPNWLIFFRGVETTNQTLAFSSHVNNSKNWRILFE